MKHKIILLLTISLGFVSCKAQTIPLADGGYGDQNNAYYKDVDNDFDKFIGTWFWQDGNKTLSITMQKIEAFQHTAPLRNVTFQTDMLIGEIIYTENGQEVINTMHFFSSPFVNGWEHTLSGVLILSNEDRPPCDTCAPGERRVRLSFTDPDRRHISNEFIFRHVINGAQEEIHTALKRGFVDDPNDPNDPDVVRIPYGDYVFVKQ